MVFHHREVYVIWRASDLNLILIWEKKGDTKNGGLKKNERSILGSRRWVSTL